MDLAQLANLGEFIGGLAVIASLVYVGLQVRQNTLSVREANSQRVSDAALQYVTTLGSDPQVASTFNRGLAGEELSPAEQAQFTYLYHGWLRQTEQTFYLFRNGSLDVELWEGLLETSRAFLGSPNL